MANIQIFDKINENWITLPRAYYSVGSEEVANMVEMASGKLVKDVKGHRKSISAQFSYVPADTVRNLCNTLRLGGFHQVTYEDLNGDTLTENFSISQPQMTVFKYVNNVAMWAELALEMTGQEVF